MSSETNPKHELFEKFKQINTFIFDIDGVLTNGQVLASESGELLRSFNTKDGYAMHLASKIGYNICIISGGKGEGTRKRFEAFNIGDIHMGVSEKVEVFENYIRSKNINTNQVLYMGDDIPDLELMRLVGLPCCPADAVEEIKSISAYISPRKGGDAAVRDVIEKVLKLQGKWENTSVSAATSSL